jgi:hypothetical protein
VAPPPKSEAQLELEKWDAMGSNELKRWSPEKRSHLNDLLGKAHQDPKKSAALVGTLMDKLNSIKERMDGHFEVGTLYHEVEIHGFPGNGDTETLRKLLRIIDPEMDANDLEQTIDSTIFYGQLMITEGQAAGTLQDTKNLKVMSIRFTQKFLEWGSGARDTGHAAADKLVLYKNYRQEYVDGEGVRRPSHGRLMVSNRTPAFQAIQYILYALETPHLKAERFLLSGFVDAVKTTLLEDHIDAIRISRFQFQGTRTGPTARTPTLLGLDKANMQLFVRNEAAARGLVDGDVARPHLRLGNAQWSMLVPLEVQHLADNSKRMSEHDHRRKKMDERALDYGLSFDPPRPMFRLTGSIEYTIQKGGGDGIARGLQAQQDALVRGLGGETRGLFAALPPFDQTNKLVTKGSQESYLYVYETGAGAVVPSVNASDLRTRLQNGTALLDNSTYKQIRPRGELTIKRLSREDVEEEQLSNPIDAPQMEYRIECHLREVGPLYLFSETESGQPWAFPGEELEGVPVPKREDLGRIGDPITVAGTVYTDARLLCSPGEMSFSNFLAVLKGADGHGAVIFSQDADIRPNGRDALTVHSVLRNIYSTEKRVEMMQADPPPPPPPPPASDQAPPPQPPPPRRQR